MATMPRKRAKTTAPAKRRRGTSAAKTARRRETRWQRMEGRAVFATCDAFVRQRKRDDIVAMLKGRFNEAVRRSQIYHVLEEGLGRGFFQLTPPRDIGLSQRMEDRFVLPRIQRGKRAQMIDVVTPGVDAPLDYVARAAASRTFQLITATAERLGGDAAVHVGFGAGATTMLVAQHLAELLRAMDRPPRVVLHALSSGFSVRAPAFAPVSFFSFFHGIVGTEARGLFSTAYVRTVDWERTKKERGVREAFAERDLVHIIVTSLASKADEHGELNRFMREYDEEATEATGRETRDLLDVQEQRVGDVMYRPFSKQAPITRDTAIRAVTMYELSDLVDFVTDPNRAVVLVCGPCGECGRLRDDALLPLLTEDALAVWSHLVTDECTAERVLNATLSAAAPRP